jgi:hypothetical protein
LARWGRWRDREFAEHYWFASDLGTAGRAPAVLPQMVADLHAKGQIGRFMDLFTHREKPSQVLSPARLAGSAGRLLRHQRDRRAVLNEVKTLISQNAHRQVLNHRRAYATPIEIAQNAGPAEAGPAVGT